MRVIAKRTLRQFWQRYPDSEQPLRAWHDEAAKASWRSPADIKCRYRHAGFIPGNRVVFNIAGNRYRLVVAMDYARQIAFIRFVGTHRDYDRIDVETL